MHATLPLLRSRKFPVISRDALTTLQVNLGYKCNQACFHCHVNASPTRTEMMDAATIADVVALLKAAKITTLDLTGGAPELNEHFRALVQAARGLGVRVIDRCNLTILEEPGQENLAQFLADNQVEICASLPCYSQKNVDAQRGEGTFEKSIRGLRVLNLLGYGVAGSGLTLNLVYNPVGAFLPPAQESLQADYTRLLFENFGVRFNTLFTITNMPIQRFGSTLISKGQFEPYMDLLVGAHREENLSTVMCRSLVSIDYQGDVYDCDFNQMLGLPLRLENKPKAHIRDLIGVALEGNAITVRDHCYGCTAGRGSSCGGQLDAKLETEAKVAEAA